MTDRGSVSPRDAAQRIGVRLDTLYQKIWAGKLPANKVNGRWRIPKAAFETLVQRKQKSSQPSPEGRRGTTSR